MPKQLVKTFVKKTGKSKAEVEDALKKARKIASTEGHTNQWDYIVGIAKKILGMKKGKREEVEFMKLTTKELIQKYLESKENDFDKFLEMEGVMMSGDFEAPEKVADEEDEEFESEFLKDLEEAKSDALVSEYVDYLKGAPESVKNDVKRYWRNQKILWHNGELKLSKKEIEQLVAYQKAFELIGDKNALKIDRHSKVESKEA